MGDPVRADSMSSGRGQKKGAPHWRCTFSQSGGACSCSSNAVGFFADRHEAETDSLGRRLLLWERNA